MPLQCASTCNLVVTVADFPCTLPGGGSSAPDSEVRPPTASSYSTHCTRTYCCSRGLAAGAAARFEADGDKACGPRYRDRAGGKDSGAKGTVLDVLVAAGGDGWRAKRGPTVAWQVGACTCRRDNVWLREGGDILLHAERHQ